MCNSTQLNSKFAICILLEFSEFLHDLNPKNWTCQFHKVSFWYLVLMALFYHGVSIGLMQLGSILVTTTIPDYEYPSFPVSIVMAATSGPIEETLFFGIPYYLSGNPHAMLATGVIWSIAHLFSTQVFSINALGYVSFLITIPHIFFSFRMWKSGKGWFAILFHSAWNLMFLISYCSAGLRSCTIIGEFDYFVIDLFSLALAGSLLSVVSLLYFKHKITKPKFTMLMALSVTVFVISEIVINLKYFQMFFPNLGF